MSRIGQISIASPGAPLELKFDESALKRVLESEANAGDHVTLYPGDYTLFDDDEDIEIRRGVTVTILPGAKVEYGTGFRNDNFAHDGRPTDSIDSEALPNHPLSDGARYITPSFTGHVENIVDLNFGSEWAFESDLEGLRTEVDNLKVQGDAAILVDVESRNKGPLDMGFGETLEVRTNPGIDVDFDRLSSDDGVYLDFQSSGKVTNVSGGNKIEMKDSTTTGAVVVDHEEISTSGSPQNSGKQFIQSVTVDDGHVVDVTESDVAVLKDREPQSFDGEDGDIWLVEEGALPTRNVYLSTREPNNLEGNSSPRDLWFVNESVNSVGKPGNLLASPDAPTSGDGAPGDIFLQSDDMNEDTTTLQDVLYKLRPPNATDEDDGDIWTIET